MAKITSTDVVAYVESLLMDSDSVLEAFVINFDRDLTNKEVDIITSTINDILTLIAERDF